MLGDKDMNDIHNARLLRLKEKTLPYKFKVVHRPGKLHKGADYASRYPQGEPSYENIFFIESLNLMVDNFDFHNLSWVIFDA